MTSDDKAKETVTETLKKEATKNKWEEVVSKSAEPEHITLDTASHVPSGPIEETLSELKADLAEKIAELEKHKELWLRSEASRQNLETRMMREMDKMRKYGVEKLVAEFIQVVDSLEQGIDLGSKELAEEQQAMNSMLEGLNLTHKMVLDILSKYGVAQLNPVGEKYDPHRHEAISTQPSEEAEPNTVLWVVQKGYQLHERLIRPARVIVVKAE